MNNENCTNCKFCTNLHTDKDITILDDDNILRGLYCGICNRYNFEVSENDCCSNYEERRETNE